MELNTDQIVKGCINQINDKIRTLKKLNIIVVGKSGVGKSTLINSLFRGNLTETGLGRPVTSEIRKIEKKDFPLAIYDTPGFELSKGQQNKVKDEILELINKGQKGKDVNEAIHCIWYCINVGGNRTFDSTELEWIRDLTNKNKTAQVPIIIVLTQACPKKKALEMKALVEAENLDVVKVVPVLAQDLEFDEEYTAKAFGLDQLIDVMSESLPNELQDTLQNVQKASLEAKKKHCQGIIAAAVASSVAEACIPVPMADATMLVPTQIGMIASITVVFGMDVSKSFITGFITSALGTTGATIVGRTIATNLLKLIPGVGSITGSVISSGTAGIITAALGETYVAVMEKIFKGEMRAEELQTKEGKKMVASTFKGILKKDKLSKKGKAANAAAIGTEEEIPEEVALELANEIANAASDVKEEILNNPEALVDDEDTMDLFMDSPQMEETENLLEGNLTENTEE